MPISYMIGPKSLLNISLVGPLGKAHTASRKFGRKDDRLVIYCGSNVVLFGRFGSPGIVSKMLLMAIVRLLTNTSASAAGTAATACAILLSPYDTKARPEADLALGVMYLVREMAFDMMSFLAWGSWTGEEYRGQALVGPQWMAGGRGRAPCCALSIADMELAAFVSNFSGYWSR